MFIGDWIVRAIKSVVKKELIDELRTHIRQVLLKKSHDMRVVVTEKAKDIGRRRGSKTVSHVGETNEFTKNRQT